MAWKNRFHAQISCVEKTHLTRKVYGLKQKLHARLEQKYVEGSMRELHDLNMFQVGSLWLLVGNNQA